MSTMGTMFGTRHCVPLNVINIADGSPGNEVGHLSGHRHSSDGLEGSDTPVSPLRATATRKLIS